MNVKIELSGIWLANLCSILLLLTICGFADLHPEVMLLLYIAGVTVLLFLYAVDRLHASSERFVFWASYVIRIAYMIYKAGVSAYSEPSLAADAAGFWDVAVQYSSGDFARRYTAFPYVLNAEFHLFGINYQCCIVTNILLSMIAVLIVAEMAGILKIDAAGRSIAIAMCCFMPYSFQMSMSLWRESLYIFFIVLSMREYLLYLVKGWHPSLYYAYLILIPVLVLHIGYFPIVVVYFISYLLNEQQKGNRNILSFVIHVILLAGFIWIASTFDSTSYLPQSGLSLEAIIKRISGDSGADSGLAAGSRYLTGLEISSLGSLLLYGPLKWFYYLSSPLPMNWRGLGDVAAFLCDGLVHLLVFMVGLVYLWRRAAYHGVNESQDEVLALRYKFIKTDIWIIALCALTFGLGVSTAGTAMRHRDVMIGLEALILAIAASSDSDN